MIIQKFILCQVGLSETISLKKVLKKNQIKKIDGISEVYNFLKNPEKDILFLDCLFCEGGCIGGPHTNKKKSLMKKKKELKKYLLESKREDIPENRKGLIEKASGLKFSY